MTKPFSRSAEVSRARLALRACAIVLAAAALTSVVADPAGAQWWPWAQQEPPPRPPREPMRAPPPPSVPAPLPGQSGVVPRAPQGAQGNVCLQLEQRLVSETQRTGSPRDQLPRIEQELRQAEAQVRQAQVALDRGECTEWFFFQKSLRKTPQCIRANDDLERARRRMGELDGQRQQLQGSGTSSFRDDIIRELARNNCGPQYAAEARKLDRGGFWQTDEDTPQKADNSQFGNLPFATYRTVCVRTCDGYFFPISFSTLPNHFQRDVELCKSRCAAPVELYYYQNPGGDIKQAVSVANQTPYTSLRSALRYQKEYVQGCSCKESEYVAASEQPTQPAPGQAPRRPAAPAPKQ
ncbi:MAG: hypothetical protein RL291_1305 [Pseudomonadota bacterium]